MRRAALVDVAVAAEHLDAVQRNARGSLRREQDRGRAVAAQPARAGAAGICCSRGRMYQRACGRGRGVHVRQLALHQLRTPRGGLILTIPWNLTLHPI